MSEIELKKRFWVFEIEQYYPGGGLSDICGTFDRLDDARKFAKDRGDDFRVYIFDVDERIEVNIYTTDEIKEQNELIPCPYIFKKGKNVGKQCIGKGSKRYNGLCDKHYRY